MPSRSIPLSLAVVILASLAACAEPESNHGLGGSNSSLALPPCDDTSEDDPIGPDRSTPPVSAPATPSASSSGTLGAAIVAEARKHVGYKSDAAGCNKFTAALGIDACHAWCSDFDTYVWQKAGADIGGLSSYTLSFEDYARKHGTWKAGRENPNVAPGDVAIWAGADNGPSDPAGKHVAIVSAVNTDGTITFVHGNFYYPDTSVGQVYETTSARSSSAGTGGFIIGYAGPVR